MQSPVSSFATECVITNHHGWLGIVKISDLSVSVQEDQSTVQLLAVAMKNKSKNKLMTRKWIFIFKSAKGWVVHWCQVLVYNIPSIVHVEQCPALISLQWNINCTCQNVRKIGKAEWQKRANIVKNEPRVVRNIPKRRGTEEKAAMVQGWE